LGEQRENYAWRGSNGKDQAQKWPKLEKRSSVKGSKEKDRRLGVEKIESTKHM